jgi:phage terminase large subunit-like protein
LPPIVPWRVWLILAGRGWGKTRTGAEWVLQCSMTRAGVRVALVGETLQDTRGVMVEGESGLLAISPPWHRPQFQPSRRLLTWPNGSQAQLFSAEDPEQLRGPQFHYAWCDEVAKWPYPQTWDNLLFGLRLGETPQVVATTTPRPKPWLKAIREAADTVCTTGSTFDNAAHLPSAYLAAVQQAYAGTRLGRQELYAEWLEDTPGALWTRRLLEGCHVPTAPTPMVRTVVGVDPSVTAGGGGAETGIIVAGVGEDGLYYILADSTLASGPDGWAKAVAEAYHAWQADRIIAEANNGGDLVRKVLHTVDATLPITLVYASRGKTTRAEPIAALYEQGKVRHVGAGLARLEDQLCTFDGQGTSPDRFDALVWALTALLEGKRKGEMRVRVL